jgi:hypothetical protein
MQFSTGAKVYILGTGSVRAAFNGGYLKLYGGAVPGSADAAIGSATLLATVSVNGDGTGLSFAATAVGGELSKDSGEVWYGTGLATGTVTFARFVLGSDTGTLSTTERRIQVTVGTQAADFLLGSLSVTSGVDTAPIYSCLLYTPAYDGYALWSTGLCNAILDTDDIKTLLTDTEMRIYTGDVPVSADASIGSATLVCTVSKDGLGGGFDFETVTSSTLYKKVADTWEGTAGGETPDFFRIVATADDGTESATAYRIQGTIGIQATDVFSLGDGALPSGTFTLNNFDLTI